MNNMSFSTWNSNERASHLISMVNNIMTDNVSSSAVTPRRHDREVHVDQDRNDMNLDAEFKALGEQLGWFQYANLDDAINALSSQCKKKKRTERLNSKKKTRVKEKPHQGASASSESHDPVTKSVKSKLKLKKKGGSVAVEHTSRENKPPNERSFSDSVCNLSTTGDRRGSTALPHDSTRIYRHRTSVINGSLTISPIRRDSLLSTGSPDDSYEQMKIAPLAEDSLEYHTCHEAGPTHDSSLVYDTVLSSPVRLGDDRDDEPTNPPSPGRDRQGHDRETTRFPLDSDRGSDDSVVEVEDRGCQTMCMNDSTVTCRSHPCPCLSNLRSVNQVGSGADVNNGSLDSNGRLSCDVSRRMSSASSANSSVFVSSIEVADNVTQTENVFSSKETSSNDYSNGVTSESGSPIEKCDDSYIDENSYGSYSGIYDKVAGERDSVDNVTPYVDNLMDSVINCSISVNVVNNNSDALDDSLPSYSSEMITGGGEISEEDSLSPKSKIVETKRSFMRSDERLSHGGYITCVSSCFDDSWTESENCAITGKSGSLLFRTAETTRCYGDQISTVTSNETDVYDKTMRVEDLEYTNVVYTDHGDTGSSSRGVEGRDGNSSYAAGPRVEIISEDGHAASPGVDHEDHLDGGDRTCARPDGCLNEKEECGSDKENFRRFRENKEPEWSSGEDHSATNRGQSVRRPVLLSSEDEDDDLEEFYSRMNTPLRSRITNRKRDEKDFIVNDDESLSDSSDDEAFHVAVRDRLHTPRLHKPPLPWTTVTITNSDDDNNDQNNDDDDDLLVMTDTVFKTPHPVGDKTPGTQKTKRPSGGSKLTPSERWSKGARSTADKTVEAGDDTAFLLSLVPMSGSKYVKQFKSYKLELAKKLFVIFNKRVFSDKLASDTEISWNTRLLKTAGRCKYKKKSCTGEFVRSAAIELSVKVCDTAERVRDTLIHEMCHAAVWTINSLNEGHGPYWKYWAMKSKQTFQCLPVVSRCHSYSITTKYSYRCVNCGYIIGRHSKSLDTLRKVCGHCHGQFELVNNSGRQPTTPQTPNKFALFVKENFGRVKSENRNSSHKDIMNLLSENYSAMKLSLQ